MWICTQVSTFTWVFVPFCLFLVCPVLYQGTVLYMTNVANMYFRSQVSSYLTAQYVYTHRKLRNNLKNFLCLWRFLKKEKNMIGKTRKHEKTLLNVLENIRALHLRSFSYNWLA